MKNYRGVDLIISDNYYITIGLAKLVKRELKILIKKLEVDKYERVCKYLIDYIIDYNPKIESEQTIAYYSWILKFTFELDHLKILEASSNGEGYTEGIEYASLVLNNQEAICNGLEVKPVFPSFSQNIVISKGVYEGLPVDAVRYPSPNHMTGWWLTTELYDDNVKSLMNVHYYHMAFKRPDILDLLALPYGYRFYVSEKERRIRFDDQIK